MTAAITNNFSIRDLLSAQGPCVTMVLPLERQGNSKDPLARAEAELKDRGIDVSLLAPVAEAYEENAGQKGSLVVLRSPDLFIAERVGHEWSPVVDAGERFHVRTVLALSDYRKPFYILALSRKRTRILECTRMTSQEVPFPAGTPTSLEDAMQTRKPDHVLDNSAAAGPSQGSMKGVMFGTSTDREDNDEYLLHFFQVIDKGVASLLKGGDQPLIAVAVEHELALYQRLNTWPYFVEPGVHGAPDAYEGGEMHRRALELLDSQAPQVARAALADFDKKVGTDHASVHIQQIVAAAYEGRVSHLFMQQNAQYRGTYDPVRGRVKHHADELDSPVDLIDEAAVQTIMHGGQAQILPGSAMPEGTPVCAIFRYPAERPAVSE